MNLNSSTQHVDENQFLPQTNTFEQPEKQYIIIQNLPPPPKDHVRRRTVMWVAFGVAFIVVVLAFLGFLFDSQGSSPQPGKPFIQLGRALQFALGQKKQSFGYRIGASETITDVGLYGVMNGQVNGAANAAVNVPWIAWCPLQAASAKSIGNCVSGVSWGSITGSNIVLTTFATYWFFVTVTANVTNADPQLTSTLEITLVDSQGNKYLGPSATGFPPLAQTTMTTTGDLYGAFTPVNVPVTLFVSVSNYSVARQQTLQTTDLLNAQLTILPAQMSN